MLCVALALACVAAAFLFVKTSRPVEQDIALLSGEDGGRLVAVSGRLVAPALYETGFYARLCASACVSFFVPKQIAAQISASRVDLAKLRSGAALRVEGIVREDDRSERGLRIEVANPDALELLRS